MNKLYLLSFLMLPTLVQAQLFNRDVLANKGDLISDESLQFTNAGIYTGTANGVFEHNGPAIQTFVNNGSFNAVTGHTDAFYGYYRTHSGNQEIAGTTAPGFYNLVLDNGATSVVALTNLTGAYVYNVLSFMNGLSTTNRVNAQLGAFHFMPGATWTSSAGNSLLTAVDAQYVDGYVSKRGLEAFTFPVGSNLSADSRPLSTNASLNNNNEIAVAYWPNDANTPADPTGGAHPRNQVEPGLLSVTNVAFWDWVPIAGSGSLTVTVSLPANYGYTDAANVRLVGWHITNARWEILGATGATGLAEGSLLIGTLPDITAYSALSAGSIGEHPLALTFLSAPAAIADKNCTVTISWLTANETGHNVFSIERSTTGSSFTEIGRVDAGSQHTYSFIDAEPARGNNYYRIRMNDDAGVIKYSLVARANNNCGAGLIQVYPTLTSNVVDVALPASWATASLHLYNNMGQQLPVAETGAGTTHRAVSLANLPSATYLLQIVNGTELENFKLTKQ